MRPPANRVCASLFDNRFTNPLAKGYVTLGQQVVVFRHLDFKHPFPPEYFNTPRATKTGGPTVGFGDHPEPVTRDSAVGAQEPKPMLQTQLVFLHVLGGTSAQSPLT